MDAPRIPVEVADHYERDVDESRRISEGFGQLELVRTREVIERHLPRRQLRVLDVGGGTGVHARWLAEAGHAVELVDPMPRHVGVAAAIAADGLAVTAQLGDARALAFVDGTFDVVLMLGPLYHLTEPSDRRHAWREALRVVRPGGLVVAAAISRFASLFDGLMRGTFSDPRFGGIVDRDLRDGQHRNPDRISGWFTTAYFHLPDELEAEAAEAGAAIVDFAGLEGLAGWLPQLGEQWREAPAREAILNSARAVESEPTLRGLSAHMLVVTRRPK
ncbi:MAG: class I SAM-dependent methyltransferase [Acidimicrobiia bacterium]